MEELVQYVAAKTGLSLDQAQQAVQATIDYFKSKVPLSSTTEVGLDAQDDGSLPAYAKNILGLLDRL